MEVLVSILFVICSILFILAVQFLRTARNMQRNKEILDWMYEEDFTPKAEYLKDSFR